MVVATITVGPFESNCHVATGLGRECLVIDPGGDADLILDHLRREKLRVAAYLLTHGHVDHVHALVAVQRVHPAPVALHPLDAGWAFSEANALPPYYEAPEAPPALDRELAEGQQWTDAGLTYSVLETPGHSPGSVSFYFAEHKILFGGDVLFRDSVGRTDLPGGDPGILARALKRLTQLPDDTTVYTGHGPATTLGWEKRNNFFLRA
jgi:glyoxylase-like metal-dependent hydrolase (beta-lactamase superfamily II)